MWFNKLLNPERAKKIKGNRETFGLKADMLIIYNLVFTTSLSVYSELPTAFQDQFYFVIGLSRSKSREIGGAKLEHSVRALN